MKSFRACALGALLFLTGASPARAQGFISPFLGFNYGGDVAATWAVLVGGEEGGRNWGVSCGKTSAILGLEEEFGYSKDFFEKPEGGDNAVLTLMSSLMAVVPAGPIRPYALFGIGLIRP